MDGATTNHDRCETALHWKMQRSQGVSRHVYCRTRTDFTDWLLEYPSIVKILKGQGPKMGITITIRFISKVQVAIDELGHGKTENMLDKQYPSS